MFSFCVCSSLVWWGGWGLYGFGVVLILLLLYYALIVLVGLVVVLLALVAWLEFVSLTCWFWPSDGLCSTIWYSSLVGFLCCLGFFVCAFLGVL